ncbi:hypothetical protein [Glycomyces salinus]|uniref:hypothetical protein n=1 Tax=Glycomyces salinus TaxID=980294 RepID=UPI0018EB707C|nr:hypothetical protein [Glycomyces salinus]
MSDFVKGRDDADETEERAGRVARRMTKARKYGPVGDYIKGTDHAASIDERMDLFEKALVRRWRREMVERLDDGESIITGIVRPTYGNIAMEHASGPFETTEWFVHKDYCNYVHFLTGDGDPDEIGSFDCKGWVDPRGQQIMHPEVNGATLGPSIDCPLGPVLELVESWAAQERLAIQGDIRTRFHEQDVFALETAHGAAEMLRASTLAEYADIDVSKDEHHGLAGGGDLSGTVAKIWAKDGDSRDWWVGWTGLAAEHVKGNFCTSAGPALMNHCIIATTIGNLVNDRAAIIEAARHNTLHLIEQATKALDDQTLEATTLVSKKGWKTFTGFTNAMSLWSALGGPELKLTAALLRLTGFLGESSLEEIKVYSFPEKMVEIVTGLVDGFLELKDEIEGQEAKYAEAAGEARSAVNDAASFDLELYDLGENTPGGPPGKGPSDGYEVNISDVLTLAEYCEAAASDYEGLLRHFGDLLDAGPHLAGEDGEPTEADKDVRELSSELKGFFKTTSARYYLARDEIRSAAEAYAQIDEDSADAFERTMDSWDRSGVGDADPGFNVDRAAEPTDRDEDASDNPYNGELGGDPNYYTEENAPR